MAITQVRLGPNIDLNISKVRLAGDVVFDRGAGGGNDVDVQALLDQAVLDGYTACSGIVLDALNALVTSLKANSIWTSLDALWVFATNGDSDFACYNLKDPTSFECGKVGPPIFTVNQGFKGNGSSHYLTPGFIPSTDGVNYTQNKASIGVYTLINQIDGETEIGCSDNSGSVLSVLLVLLSGVNQSRLNNVSAFTTISPITTKGLIHLNRDLSTNSEMFLNGSSKGTSNVISATPPNREFNILANNFAGTPSRYSSNELGLAFIGGDLNTKEVLFYNAFETYMIDIQGYEAETVTLLKQGVTDGYELPSLAVRSALNTLISTLKTEGIWALLDFLYVFATDGDRDFAKYNLKDPSNFACSEISSPLFTEKEGFTGTATGYLQSGYRPNLDKINLSLTSASIGMYFRTDTGGNTYHGVTDASGFNPGYYLFPSRVGFRNVDHALNDAFDRVANPGDATGLHHSTKTGTTKRVYRNGAQLGTDITRAAGLIPNGNMFLLALNNLSSGSPTFIANGMQLSIAYGGGHISDNSTLYTIIQDYMTSLGTQV